MFRKFSSDLKDMIKNDFNLMFIPKMDIWGGQETIRLKYAFDNAREYTCSKIEHSMESFDPEYYIKCTKSSKAVIIEIKDLGSFIFTDHPHSDLFLILQRDFPEVTSYVFCGNTDGGYFKILQNGKIQRKIASFLCMDGIRNYPETRGKPCRYEIETGHIYKADLKARHMKDCIKGFTCKEVLDLFDYYVGLDRFTTGNIQRVLVYSLSC